MIHREIIHLFYQNMKLEAQNRYVIQWKGQRCYVDVEDTAYVVLRTVYEGAKSDQPDRYLLYLSDDSIEELLPETLFVGENNVLYCKVKNETFPARFTRPAYYQIAEHITEENNMFYLPQNQSKYKISMGDGN
jgi:hypothetical protein